MPYNRRRRTTRSRYTRRPVRRRRTTRRRRSTAQKIIVQVIGGPGGYTPISATAGKKGRAPIRRRH